MLESIPVPFQVLLWPLLGAAVIGLLGRILPGWMRRLLGMAAAGLSLLALCSLRGMAGSRVELIWAPLGLFRTSPSLMADELALASGILLSGLVLALLLGLGRRTPGESAWQGLLLLSLAGTLGVVLASNLLTLALGSALLDLALVGLALWDGAVSELGWEMPLSLAVPGIASTLVLLAGALQIDVSAGHTSLLASDVPAAMVIFLGIAALLRLSPFPLHPRGLRGPQNAASLLLPAGAGIYLFARSETLALGPWSPSWVLVLGFITLLGGGVLAWSGALTASRQEGAGDLAGFWSGLLVHQVGYVLLFWKLLGKVAPWPLVSLPLSLGALAIWWHVTVAPQNSLPPGRLSRLWEQLGPRRAKLRRWASARFPLVDRWPGRRVLVWLVPLVPFVILASLAGAPLTAGARVRWPVYAALLKRASGGLLLLLAADSFLVAGLGTAFRAGLLRTKGRRHSLAALAAAALALLLVLVAVWPGSLGLRPARVSGVSPWGLGLIFVLPWLLGAWLVRLRGRLSAHAGIVHSLVELDWLFATLSWIGQRLTDFFSWLGQVGEGAGWWGWALIIMALGAIFLGSRG
jgi:hypothetical protein